MNLKHICFIVPGYPTDEEPVYTFVKQLVCSVADLGIKCSVIAPQSITNTFFRRKKIRPFHWQDISDKNYKVDIYQPRYISLSNIKIFNTSISSIFSQRAIINTFNKIKINPDVLYAHFWHSGVVAGIIGKKYNIPVFVATGESRISIVDKYREKKLLDSLEDIKGVICVSTKNMEESINLGLAPKEKMVVIPNSINNKLFYHIDKKEARKELGFNQDDFIVAFTGSFTHRKGVLRVSEAIKKLDNVKSIYIGSGKQRPNDDGILFCGRLPHHKIVKYLNAADVFVLPTLAEGCCNAIIEAMACGLPIISSNKSFNDDILNEKNSIRIDSNNVDEIANAIQYLKENHEVRNEMGKASLEKAKELDINKRAQKIIQFIKERSEVM